MQLDSFLEMRVMPPLLLLLARFLLGKWPYRQFASTKRVLERVAAMDPEGKVGS